MQGTEYLEEQEVQIDRMMAAAADRDLAEPWQAVKAALADMGSTAEAQAFCSRLHAALVAQGHDPNDEAYV